MCLLNIWRMIDQLNICRHDKWTCCIFWWNWCVTFERSLSDDSWRWRRIDLYRKNITILWTVFEMLTLELTNECDSCDRWRFVGDKVFSSSESWSALNIRFFVEDWGWTTRGCMIILSFWSSSIVQFLLSSSSSSSSSSDGTSSLKQYSF